MYWIYGRPGSIYDRTGCLFCCVVLFAADLPENMPNFFKLRR